MRLGKTSSALYIIRKEKNQGDINCSKEKMGELENRFKEDAEIKKEWLVENPPFPSRHLLLEVTNACNNKCVFCFNSKMTRPKKNMDYKFGERVLREAFENGSREVGFYATGEPLIHPEICKFISIAKQIGYEYTYITTNGSLLNRSLAKGLIESGLDSIKFSINAGTRRSYELIHGRDEFDKVLNNVKEFYSLRGNRNVNIFVSCVVTKMTESEVSRLKDELDGYVDEFIFVPVLYMGMTSGTNGSMRVDDNAERFRGGWPCPYLFNSVVISCEGYLTACCQDFQNYLAVEDLNKMSLIDAWNSERYKQLRRNHLNKILRNTMCYNCLYGGNETIEPINYSLATIYESKLNGAV